MCAKKQTDIKDKPNSITTDAFREQIKQVLEHWGDDLWLEDNSPFAASYFIGIDRERGKRLMTLVQMALERLPASYGTYEPRKLLRLRYLDHINDGQLRKHETVARQLGLSTATYFRHLNDALIALSESFLQLACPSLYQELPPAKPMVGREKLLEDCEVLLKQGNTLTIMGGSGLGKSLLGAHLAEHWGKSRVFWYTIRPGLNDQLHQFLFSLTCFFHKHHSSSLWLQLTANPDRIDIQIAQTLLTRAFEQMRMAPPLLCVDEISLLLPDEFEEDEEHARLRGFLEWLATTERAGAPLLLIGQKLVMQPQNPPIDLQHLDVAQTELLLRQSGLNIELPEVQRLHHHTQGNPLLLHLFIVLHRLGQQVATTMNQLSTPPSLEWLIVRIQRHLSISERDVLLELSVYDAPAPADAFHNRHKVLTSLLSLGIVTEVEGNITIHPSLREVIYRNIPETLKKGFHVIAGMVNAERGRYTLAAYHLVHGGRFDAAVWIWQLHSLNELKVGQASAALNLFAKLKPDQFQNDKDRQVFALLVADLCRRCGKSQPGAQMLDEVKWQHGTPTHARAQELKADFLRQSDQIDAAVRVYRAGLDDMWGSPAFISNRIHTKLGRQYLVRYRDVEKARREAQEASCEAHLLHAEIAIDQGEQGIARTHLREASHIAESINDYPAKAKALDLLGVLEAGLQNIDMAVACFKESIDCCKATGNLEHELGIMQNLAYAYLMDRDYAKVISPASEALTFFLSSGQPYRTSVNATNLAEAHLYLGNLAEAEYHLGLAMQQEESAVLAYCLYIDALLSARRGHFDQSEARCQEAIRMADAQSDQWALGAAWRVMGEIQIQQGRPQQAYQAYDKAKAIFTKLGIEKEVAYLQKKIEKLES